MNNNNTRDWENLDPSMIKNNVFDALKTNYKDIPLSRIDCKCNNIKIELRLSNDFKSIENFSNTYITISFKIKTKRADQIIPVTKTKSKYLHKKALNCLKISSLSITSWEKCFKIKKGEDFKIVAENGYIQNYLYFRENISVENSINDIIKVLPEGYNRNYTKSIVDQIIYKYKIDNDAKSFYKFMAGTSVTPFNIVKNIENIISNDCSYSYAENDYLEIVKYIEDNNLIEEENIW